MKKLIVVAAVLMFATPCFAATLVAGDGDIPALEGFQHSKNVSGAYDSETRGSGSSGPDVYSIGTKHSQGNKNYITGSSTTYMYQEDVDQTADVQTVAAPASTSDTAVFDGLNKM